MKLTEFFFIIIIITNIYQSNQSYLNLANYESEHYQINTGTLLDLIGIKVECPHSGILKNFVLRKNSNEFWYEYQCYSSKSDDSDEGEPIIKDFRYSGHNVYPDLTIPENIRTLKTYPLYSTKCVLDYGLNSFKIINEHGTLKIYIICYALKPKYTTKIEIKTEEGSAPSPRLESLVGIVVGSKETEDDENIAYPLRGFKNYVYNEDKNTLSFYYGYSVLRNMKKELENTKQTFERLRNCST